MRHKKHNYHKFITKKLILIVSIVSTLLCVSIGVFLFFHPTKKPLFDTLDDIIETTKINPENPTPDNDDPMNPSYVSFYQKQYKNFITSLFSRTEWSNRAFENLITKVIKQQEQKNFTKSYISKITPPPIAKFIIWGDLQGAFHSFSRTLKKLKDMSIINHNLEIIKQHYYFIFTGDVINRSPYSLETLSIVLRLIERNPDKIFYMRGNHEYEDHFQYGMTKELQYKARNPELTKTLERFFNTLPLALFITIPQNNNTDFVQVSHHIVKDNNILDNITDVGTFLTNKTHPLIHNLILKQNEQNTPQSPYSISAHITGQSHSTLQTEAVGLVQLPQEKEAITWSPFSSPTRPYNTVANFFYDAFCILETQPIKDNWTITLYQQDIRTKTGFIQNKFKFFKGVSEEKSQVTKTKPGIPSDAQQELCIGTTVDQTSGVSTLGKELLQGLTLRIQLANKNNECAGIFIKFIPLNDKYTPHIAAKNVETLLSQHNTSIIIASLGAQVLTAYSSLIKDKKILALFPSAGSDNLRHPHYSNIIFLKTSYAHEAEIITDCAITKYFKNKFAIFYQDDDFGKTGLDGIKKAFEHHKIKNDAWIAVSYQANSTDVETAAEKIKDFNPDALIIVATPIGALSLFSKLNPSWLVTKHIFGISPIGDPAFLNTLKQKGIKITISHVIPPAQHSKLDIVKEYHEAIKKSQYTPSPYSLEGYITTSLLVDIIKKISPPITKEKIIEQCEKIKNYNFKGLELDFDPQTRTLLHDVWIESDTGVITHHKIKRKENIEPALIQATPPHDTHHKELTIATILDLSGAGSSLHQKALEGLEACITYENSHGGINGANIKLLVRDHKYSTQETVKHVQNLITQNISIILMPMSTESIKACLPFAQDKKILLLFPNAHTQEFAHTPTSHFISLRPTYEQEAQALAHYALTKVQKFAIVYQQDSFGISLYNAAQDLFKKQNINTKNWITISHERNSTEGIAGIVQKIKEFNPDGILLFSVPTIVSNLFTLFDQAWLSQKQIFCPSTLAIQQIKNLGAQRDLKITFSHVVPNYKDKSNKLAQHYLEALKIKNAQADSYSFQGYISAKTFIEIARTIKDKSITQETLISTIEHLKDFNLDGLHLTFDPKTKSLNNQIWIETETGTWLLYTYTATHENV